MVVDLFPNATMWIQKDEDSTTSTRRARSGIGAAWTLMTRRCTRRFKSAGRIRLVEGDNQEIAPGIRVYTGGKHTFASQYVAVTTRDGTVIVASDNAYLYKNIEERLPIAQTLDRAMNLAAAASYDSSWPVRPPGVVPGHDPAVFSRFPQTAPNVVRIAPR